MTPGYLKSCANTLSSALACAERPDDNRLNSHLTKLEIGATIRVVMTDLRAAAMRMEEEAEAEKKKRRPMYIIDDL